VFLFGTQVRAHSIFHHRFFQDTQAVFLTRTSQDVKMFTICGTLVWTTQSSRFAISSPKKERFGEKRLASQIRGMIRLASFDLDSQGDEPKYPLAHFLLW
jgi:hypothetical protein